MLCDAPNGRGGTWNRDGVIVFTPDSLGGLSRVSSSGGSPIEMTKPDTSRFETTHRWPVFLADGKHFLYLAANFSGQLENNAIFLGSLDSQDRRLLVNTSANAAYAEPGYLLYLRDKTLVAQPFDRRRYVLSGEPHPLSDDVLYFPGVDRAVFSVSSGEVLVTQTGRGASVSQLTWFDRRGKAAGRSMVGSYPNVRLSPDGRKVAEQADPDGRTTHIWIYEPVRSATTRLTFDPSLHQAPIWSPDGRQILFGSNSKVGFHLYLKNADGSGSEEQVADFGAGMQVNLGTGRAMASTYCSERETSCGTSPGLSAWPSRCCKSSGRYGTHSFPPMAAGWFTPRMRRGVWRSTCPLFRLATASGRCQAQEDRSRDGARTERSCSTCRRTES